VDTVSSRFDTFGDQKGKYIDHKDYAFASKLAAAVYLVGAGLCFLVHLETEVAIIKELYINWDDKALTFGTVLPYLWQQLNGSLTLSFLLLDYVAWSACNTVVLIGYHWGAGHLIVSAVLSPIFSPGAVLGAHLAWRELTLGEEARVHSESEAKKTQ